MPGARAIAAGLAATFPHAFAIGSPGVLAKRRGGNVVLVGAHALPLLERLRFRVAADPSPGAVLAPEEIPAFVGGVPPWRD
jgi:hypothetical protein